MALSSVPHISFVEGRVLIERSGEKQQALVSSEVVDGDVITTSEGSRIEITITGEEIVRIDENATVSVAEILHRNGDEKVMNFFAKVGKFFFRVKKKVMDDKDFNVRTPTSIIGVRGTEFGVKVQTGGETDVVCFKGKVGVQGREKEVIVPEGMFTSVQIQGDPSDPQSMSQSQTMEWSGWISGGLIQQRQKLPGLPEQKQEMKPLKPVEQGDDNLKNKSE